MGRPGAAVVVLSGAGALEGCARYLFVRDLRISSHDDYKEFKKICGGSVRTWELEQIESYIESGEHSLHLIFAPPGSGKTFLLHELWDKYDERCPVMFLSYSGVEGGEACKELKDEGKIMQWIANALKKWLFAGLDTRASEAVEKAVKESPTAFVVIVDSILRRLQSRRTEVAGKAGENSYYATRFPFLILIDELNFRRNSQECVEALELFLRKLTEMLSAFSLHVVITSHMSRDVGLWVLNELKQRGTLQRFEHHTIDAEIRPLNADDIKKFLRQLLGEASASLDDIVGEFVVRMAVKTESLTFRQLVRVARAIATSEQADGRHLQPVLSELHDAIKSALESKVMNYKAEMKMKSKPDLMLLTKEGKLICLDIKTSLYAPEINLAQHSDCPVTDFIIVSPEPPRTNETEFAKIDHIRVNTRQIVSVLETLRQESENMYKGALSEFAELIARRVLHKIKERWPGIIDDDESKRLRENVIREVCKYIKQKIFAGDNSIPKYKFVKTDGYYELVAKQFAVTEQLALWLKDLGLERVIQEELQKLSSECRVKSKRDRKADCANELCELLEKVLSTKICVVDNIIRKVMLGPACNEV
jgi:heme oxygenase